MVVAGWLVQGQLPAAGSADGGRGEELAS